jgi:hypothetical protein
MISVALREIRNLSETGAVTTSASAAR